MHNKPHSEETKKRLREIALRLKIHPPSRKGVKWSEEHKEYMRKLMKNRKITWGDKISKALIGFKHTEETKNKLRLANKGKNIGNNAKNWKGDDVGYHGLHKWVARWLGKPTKCEHCGKDGLSGCQIDWANKDHKYKRNLTDWIRLCHSCHRLYDYKNNLT